EPPSTSATPPTADFNGDGVEDLAVGVPIESVASITYGGAVNVIYGSPSGLTATGNQFWTQDSAGIPGDADSGDQFGVSLATGDPSTAGDGGSNGSYPNVGAVNVIYGSPSGLTLQGNQFWTQDSYGVLDQSEAGDQFGRALAAADFGGTPEADLAIGVPNE